MAITAFPQMVQKSAASYINAGMTYTGAYTTNVTGSTTLTPHNLNTAGVSGSGSGYQKIVLSGNATLTWSSTVSTYASEWFLEIANPSTYTVSWSGVTWAGGSAPVTKTNGRTLYMFFSPDGGTTIYGKQVASNLAGVA